MNKYELQSYFEKLCDMYYAARMNAKRLGDDEGENTDEKERYVIQYWNTRAWNQFVEITAHIAIMLKNQYKPIITTKQEVYALIHYSASSYHSWDDMINEEMVHLIDYPKDEISKEYFEAYKAQDIDKMKELDKKYC